MSAVEEAARGPERREREAWVVIDLGFGDAGKGSCVDFLCRARGGREHPQVPIKPEESMTDQGEGESRGWCHGEPRRLPSPRECHRVREVVRRT